MTQFYQTFYNSPIGKITLVAHDTALVGLWLAGQKHPIRQKHAIGQEYLTRKVQNSFIVNQETSILRQTKAWLSAYFRGDRPDPQAIPLALYGSEFQLIVWQILTTIPYGETTTYGAIAQTVATQLGRVKMSAQAVGGAVGHNPISIIIPCHRVVGANGGLTGYAGGLDHKAYLLRHEGINLAQLYPHKK